MTSNKIPGRADSFQATFKTLCSRFISTGSEFREALEGRDLVAHTLLSSDLLILLNCFVWFGKICLQPSLYKCKHKSFQIFLCARICQTAFMSHFTGKPFAPPQASLKHQTPTQGACTSLCISGFPYKGIRFYSHHHSCL